MPKTQKTTQRLPLIGRISAAVLLSLLIMYSTHPGVHTATAAASCSSIADCTNQINAGKSAVSNLQNQAVSYKDAITRLGSAISSTQGAIVSSQQQQADLEQQIAKAKQDIIDQKAVLAEVIRTMYVDGQMTPIEELATSNNLSDYVDKDAYRNEVSTKIQNTLDTIAKQQADLEQKNQQVANLIASQQQQAADLRDDQSQQASMLNYNQSQQANYNAQTAANQSKLAALIAAQRSVNNSSKGGYYFIRFPGTRHGFSPASYPYAHSGFSMSTAPGCNDNDGPDKWGYCTRQCVSYTAYAVEASGRSAPKYWGNAKNWVAAAKRSGIPVYNVPQAGDVAISTSGTWGHAMYVEQVSGNQIYVSEYNQQLSGQFSYQWRQWQ